MAPCLPPFAEALATLVNRKGHDATTWGKPKRQAALVWYVVGTDDGCPQSAVARRHAEALRLLQQPAYTKAYHAHGPALARAAAIPTIIRAVLKRPGGWEAHFGEVARLLRLPPRTAQGLLPPRRLDFGGDM